MPQMISDKIVQIEDAGSVSELRCPRCGSQNLHHLGVTLFDRAEDALSVVVISVSGAVTETKVQTSADSANPSSRRHGLAVQFGCEQCGGGTDVDVIELTLAQHKGCTVIGWRYTPQK